MTLKIELISIKQLITTPELGNSNNSYIENNEKFKNNYIPLSFVQGGILPIIISTVLIFTISNSSIINKIPYL